MYIPVLLQRGTKTEYFLRKGKVAKKIYLTQRTTVLSLKDLLPSDTGSYTCNVSNSFGWINYTFKVDVHGNKKNILIINLLLRERESRTGVYWPEVVAVRTKRSTSLRKRCYPTSAQIGLVITNHDRESCCSFHECS